MDYKDLTRIHQRVPELNVVAPVLFAPWGKSNTAYYKDQRTTPRIQGCTPEYAKVIAPKLYYGRYINEMDMKEHRKVCVIGKRIYKELFKEGGDPCGKSIRIDSTYFEVIGVDYASTGMNINGRAEQKVTLPLTLMQETYNRGKEVDMIVATGREGVVMSKLTDRIRQSVTMGHFVDPTDEQAAMVFNARQPVQRCELPHLARRSRYSLSWRYRCIEHHDGDGARAHYGDRYPTCHRRHP